MLVLNSKCIPLKILFLFFLRTKNKKKIKIKKLHTLIT